MRSAAAKASVGRPAPNASSPFAPVLGMHRERLASPLAVQFFGTDGGHRVRMDGVMHRVWHRHEWLRPFFMLLAFAHIFFPDVGHDVGASMVVSPTKHGVTWRRTFAFARRRRFDATMSYRAGIGVVEQVGPWGLIQVPWCVSVIASDTIEITTGRVWLQAAGWKLMIPEVLQVAVKAVERVMGDAIEVELVLTHRYLGPIFGYDGTFNVRREGARSPAQLPDDVGLRRYRGWFYAAAAYNLAWGSVSVLAPGFWFFMIGLPPPTNPAMFQALGMMVLVYAPGYWWLARDPDRHQHLVVIAMLGKLLGPVGFLWALATGLLPLSFGLIIVANDCLWWPPFLAFLREAAERSGGWRTLATGR
jgi:small multidrug resistance pump